MKKTFSLILTLLLCSLAYAQDIIVTTESERIDAKITEVSETEVKYKSATNPNGPVFVLSTSKIASIIFQNGEVKTFSNTNNTNVTQQNTTVSVREAKDIIFVPGQKIEKIERRDYSSGSRTKYFYGNIEMDESLFRDFLKLNCQEAYKKYQIGNGLMYGGTIFLGLATGGLLGCLIGIDKISYDALVIGASVSAAGAAVGIAGLCVGAVIASKPLNVFNEQCADRKEVAQLQLSLTSSRNGIGVALNF